jgi:hypothetical protein
MAELERGQTFFDSRAVNLNQQKSKYFIALSNADFDDDLIVCFVMNTERRMEKYHIGCNKTSQKFIIKPGTFSFIKTYTSIMFDQPCCYQLNDIYEDNIKLLDKADDMLCRQIKNCIDWNYIPQKFSKLIKMSFM